MRKMPTGHKHSKFTVGTTDRVCMCIFNQESYVLSYHVLGMYVWR